MVESESIWHLIALTPIEQASLRIILRYYARLALKGLFNQVAELGPCDETNVILESIMKTLNVFDRMTQELAGARNYAKQKTKMITYHKSEMVVVMGALKSITPKIGVMKDRDAGLAEDESYVLQRAFEDVKEKLEKSAKCTFTGEEIQQAKKDMK